MHRIIPLVLALATVAAFGCAAPAAKGPKEFKIAVTDDGFVPAETVIPKNEAVTLVVTRKTDRTCATSMVFAESGEKHELPLNETVRIELAAGQPDTLHYACPMDMIKGMIVAR
jgi:plastocyanin domain-containing protein